MNSDASRKRGSLVPRRRHDREVDEGPGVAELLRIVIGLAPSSDSYRPPRPRARTSRGVVGSALYKEGLARPTSVASVARTTALWPRSREGTRTYPPTVSCPPRPAQSPTHPRPPTTMHRARWVLLSCRLVRLR